MGNDKLRVRNVVTCVLGSTNMKNVVSQCLLFPCFGLVLSTFTLVFSSRGARPASAPVTIVAISASTSLRHVRVVSFPLVLGIDYYRSREQSSIVSLLFPLRATLNQHDFADTMLN